MLRATTACTFSTSQLPKVVRTWCALYILTLKCASRHNGVQFFISHPARWLCTRRFSEPTFRPSGATNHWKSSESRLLPFRAPASSFYRLFLFSDFLSTGSFSSLTLPTSAFSSVHIVGSLTSKLPSNITTVYLWRQISKMRLFWRISTLDFSIFDCCSGGRYLKNVHSPGRLRNVGSFGLKDEQKGSPRSKIDDYRIHMRST